MDLSLSKLREVVKDREAWRAQSMGVHKSDMTEGLNNNEQNEGIWVGPDPIGPVSLWEE